MKSKSSRSIFPLAMIGIGLIFLLVAAIWFVTSNQPQEPVLVTNAPDVPYPEIPRVSVADAHAAYTSGSAVFVDVRAASDFDASHVAGALSIPFDQLSNHISELNANDWIITYCT